MGKIWGDLCIYIYRINCSKVSKSLSVAKIPVGSQAPKHRCVSGLRLAGCYYSWWPWGYNYSANLHDSLQVDYQDLYNEHANVSWLQLHQFSHLKGPAMASSPKNVKHQWQEPFHLAQVAPLWPPLWPFFNENLRPKCVTYQHTCICSRLPSQNGSGHEGKSI